MRDVLLGIELIDRVLKGEIDDAGIRQGLAKMVAVHVCDTLLAEGMVFVSHEILDGARIRFVIGGKGVTKVFCKDVDVLEYANTPGWTPRVLVDDLKAAFDDGRADW